jgi:hypothetical protein
VKVKSGRKVKPMYGEIEDEAELTKMFVYLDSVECRNEEDGCCRFWMCNVCGSYVHNVRIHYAWHVEKLGL